MAMKRAAKKARATSATPENGPVKEKVGAMKAPIDAGKGFDLLVRTNSGVVYHIPGRDLVHFRRRDIESDAEAIAAFNASAGEMIGLKNAIYIRAFVIMDGAG